MAKAKLKTQKTKKSVAVFLNETEHPQIKADAKELCRIIRNITGEKPAMWGSSIVGFGDYHYKYASGREGDFFCVGFAPRKRNLTLYVMPGYDDFGGLLKDFGPHTKGRACLHFKRLSDIHVPTLKNIISRGYKKMRKMYPKK
jgi:hypothetical protein